ncbi:MAG: arginine--tRNA ligase [Clostridia bacterium]|nr:arginine--tRNA ligase [Clostridia bacterium]
MNLISKTEQILKEVLQKNNFEEDNIVLSVSSKPELGQFQYNGAMALAKKVGTNPRAVAEQIVSSLNEYDIFENINIAGPGFINISYTKEFLKEYLTEISKDMSENVKKYPSKKVFFDYGGANVAKDLHVGHLRTANIGEALKRLTKLVGNEVMSDVHLGDIGRQSGMVIYQLREEHPDWVFFDENYKGEYPSEIPITNDDLGRIYPLASSKAKEDDSIMEEVRRITAELDRGYEPYVKLWELIRKISIANIKLTYEALNAEFDLWEGETDSYPYIEETLEILKKAGCLVESEGALVCDVKEDTDKAEIPPLVVIKTDGTTLYATRELATILSRAKRFYPDEIIYIVDNRQGMYFEQVFRTSYKSNLVRDDLKFKFVGVGTMNGTDGKPFKTRAGGVMKLNTLLSEIKEETSKYVKDNEAMSAAEQKDVSDKVAVAALKYADLLPNVEKDYIFDLAKFCSLEGKTGPYILYSAVRMKSLLAKSGITNYEMHDIYSQTEKDIITKVLEMPIRIDKAYRNKTLSDITEYIYELDSLFNKFYAENRILTEQDEEKKQTWLFITNLVYKVNKLILDVLAIDIPERM